MSARYYPPGETPKIDINSFPKIAFGFQKLRKLVNFRGLSCMAKSSREEKGAMAVCCTSPKMLRRRQGEIPCCFRVLRERF